MFDQLYEPDAAAISARASAAQSAVATTKPGDVDLEKLDLEKLALAKFDASRAAVKAATEKLSDVVHDLSTPTKVADAKSLRERLINAPLAEARKVEKGLKAKLTATSKAVGAALVAIEADFAAAALLITPQIEARDAELAAEKAERDRKEAERVAGHRANLSKLASYVTQLQGKTADQIAAAMYAIAGIDIIPEQWEEFAASAAQQKDDTLIALGDLFDRAKKAEDEAAAREAQRIENERKAAELAAREAEMAAKQAELDRQLAEIAAAKKAEADRIAAEAKAKEDAARAEAQAIARQAAEDEANARAQEAAAATSMGLTLAQFDNAVDQLHAQCIADLRQDPPDQLNDDALTAMPSIAAEVPPVEPPAAARDMDEVAAAPWSMPVAFAERPAPAADEPATLTLGQINAMFGAGFSMTAAFVESIGISPAGKQKAAVMFRPSQVAAICDALVELCGTVADAMATS